MFKFSMLLTYFLLLNLTLPVWSQTTVEGSSDLKPEPSLSLEQSLQRVYRDNPRLWQWRQEQTLWASRELQAGLGFNPELSLVSEDILGSAAFTSDLFTQFTLSLAQTMILGDKQNARVRLIQLQKQLAFWDYKLQLQTLGLEVHQAYIRLLALQAEQQVLSDMQANAQEVQRLLSRAVAVGKLSPAVLIQSELALKKLSAASHYVEVQFQSERQSLAALWGATEPDFGQLDPGLNLGGGRSLGELEQALLQHPRLARWELDAEYRQGVLSEAESQAIPDLNLSGGFRYHPPLSWGAVFSIGMPITAFNSNQGKIQEARLRQKMWLKERQIEENRLRSQFKQAYTKAQGLSQWLTLLKQQQDLAQTQYQLALKSFQAGKISSLELLNSSQNLYLFSQQLAQAQGESLLARAELMFYTDDLMPQAKN